MDFAALAYPFTLGSVAAFNPCGIAMLPAYVSYFLATEDGRLADVGAGLAARITRALAVGLALTAGFLLLFTLAGGVISAGGLLLIRSVPWMGIAIGALLATTGAWMLSGRPVRLPVLPLLRIERKRTLKTVFMFGGAYGIVSLTCTLPLFLGVVGGALSGTDFTGAVVQFLAYAVGMGAVMVPITLSLELFEGALVSRLRWVGRYVSRLGALALTLTGVYMVYYWVNSIMLMGF